jgi:AcrR family transcriptional regulator
VPRSKVQSEQIRAESREQILATARRLFAERGYDGCRVSDIASQSGMSQGNIYWYFPSKEALLKAVLADGFETLGGLMAEVASSPGSSDEKLDELIARYIAFAREQGGNEFITILVTLTAQGGVERFQELGFDMPQIGLGYHQSVNAILAQAQAEGVILQEIDPNALSTFFFAFFNGLMFTYGKDWMEIPDEVIRKTVLRLLGGGERDINISFRTDS